MKIIADGKKSEAQGTIFITYYGPKNPDGGVPSVIIQLVGDKAMLQAWQTKSFVSIRQELDQIFNWERSDGANPTLDSEGKLDPPDQPYTPDPEYDDILPV